MAFPYDISTYAVNEQGSNGLVFNFLSSRTVIFSDARGWVEIAPSQTVTATLYKNGVAVSGSSISIDTAGVVTITAPFPITIVPGDRLTIRMNADADLPATKVAGVAFTFFGEEQVETDEDDRYDVSFFIQGKLPAGRRVAAAPVVRCFDITDRDSWVERASEASVLLLTFILEKNRLQIGVLVLEANKRWKVHLDGDVVNFDVGDVFSILSPGISGEFVDETLADMSVTFKGFLPCV